MVREMVCRSCNMRLEYPMVFCPNCGSTNLLQIKANPMFPNENNNRPDNRGMFGQNVPNNRPNMGVPPQMGLNQTGRVPQMGPNQAGRVPQMGLNQTGRVPQMGPNQVGRGPQMGPNQVGRGPQMGLNQTGRVPQMGPGMGRSRSQGVKNVDKQDKDIKDKHNHHVFQDIEEFNNRTTFCTSTEPTKATGSKKILVAAAIVLVGAIAIVGACIGTGKADKFVATVSEKVTGKSEKKVSENASNDSSTNTSNGASDKKTGSSSGSGEFNAGELDGSVYTNKWANVKFDVPEGYTKAEDETYEVYNNDTMQCGMYVEDEKGGSIINIYIDLTKAEDGNEFTEREYLNQTKTQYEIYGMELENVDEYETYTIAGQEYLCGHFNISSYNTKILQSVYVRKDGDKAVVFMVTGNGASKEDNNAIVDTVKEI